MSGPPVAKETLVLIPKIHRRVAQLGLTISTIHRRVAQLGLTISTIHRRVAQLGLTISTINRRVAQLGLTISTIHRQVAHKELRETNCFRYLIDEWLPFPMVYDDINIYYNYTNKQCIHLTKRLFFFNFMNICMELTKQSSLQRVGFSQGTSKNYLWPSPTVCVDVDIKV